MFYFQGRLGIELLAFSTFIVVVGSFTNTMTGIQCWAGACTHAHTHRHTHFPLYHFCIVKAMVFPVAMYGCESWIVKKAEHRRIDAFEL